MAEVFYFHVQEDRSIKYKLHEPIMQEDKDVATWRFRIPKILNEIDMSAWSWWFVYVNAKGQKFSELLTLNNDVDDPENFSTADYPIGYGISKTPGGFTFALESINASQGGEISGEWHTRTYAHTVTSTLQGNQAEYAETESDIISALMQEVRNKVNQLVGGATPLPVNLKSLMTDHDKVYLYTGSETGESTGYWYHYNGTQFVPGGQYGAGVQIDSTPTQGSTNAVSSGGVYESINEISGDINDLKSDLNANLTGLGVQYFKIPMAIIDTNGVVVSQNVENYTFDICVYAVNASQGALDKISVDSSADRLVYAFFEVLPEVGSQSYNSSRVMTNSGVTTAKNVTILPGCAYIAIRVPKGTAAVISPNSATIANIKTVEAIKNEVGVLVDHSTETTNLFDYSTVTQNAYVDASGNAVTNNAYVLSDYIEIDSATIVYVPQDEAEGVKYVISLFDENKAFTRRLTPYDNPYQFGVTEKFMRITFIKSLNPDLYNAQVNKGVTLADYMPYRAAIDYKARKQIANFGDAYDAGQANLIDESALLKNVLINADGKSQDSDFYDSTYFIPVTAGRYIVRTFDFSGSPTYRICLYDKNHTFIRRITPTMTLWPNGYVFVVNENEKYVKVTFQNDNNANGYQRKNVLCRGNYVSEYLPYKSAVDSAARLGLMHSSQNLFPYIRESGAMFSLCDDDTTTDELVTIIHDICVDYNIKGCYAAITFRLNDDTNLAERLLGYEKEGFGVYYHCQKQINAYNPANYAEDLAQPNFVEGLREFKEYGFINDNIWIIPFGGAIPAEVNMARRFGIKYLVETAKSVADYQKYVTVKHYNMPSPYLNRFCILRQSLGFGAGTPSVSEIKATIDECVDNGGWIIFMTHANTWYEKDSTNNFIHDSEGNLVPIVYDGMTGEEKMREILTYLQSKTIKNVTIAEGASLYEPSYSYYETVDVR